MLTQTGHELNDIGRTLSWDALDSFLSNLGADSALVREIHPDIGIWGTTFKTNMILADIWDSLAMLNANLIAVGTRKKAKTPKLYPRPFKKDPKAEQRIGSGGLPPEELRKWFEQKRNETCQK